MLNRKVSKHASHVLPALLFLICCVANLRAATPAGWREVGPSGGDVRDLVIDPFDPSRIYFGTLDGQLYVSADSGASWRLLYNFHRPWLVIDSLLVDSRDPQVLYVGAHRSQWPGGFHKSKDGGRTWREAPELKNESILSLEQSAKNPDLLVAGSLRGVFRSDDAGETWRKLPTESVIGPDGKPGGLTLVESLALDPNDANVMYAGTFWLPFKSVDGGQNWKLVEKGMINDSDVFDIDIDHDNPQHVIASACSGIYETKDGAANWVKIKGIPSSSRRTRAIMQHPAIKGLVFSGTTEGFWRSADGGVSWMLTTSKTLEVNSIAVHPARPNDIYIATNNYGVMVSHDAGKTFAPKNTGYSSRFAKLIVPDLERPSRIYAATINTTTGGGFFFVSDDGGQTWQPSMRNLSSRVIVNAIVQDERNPNVIMLGTNLGLYRSVDRGLSWVSVGAPKTTGRAPAVAVTDPTRPEPGANTPPPAAPAAGTTRTRRVAAAPKPKPAAKPKTTKGKKAAKPTAPKPIFLKESVAALAQVAGADGRAGILAATDKGLYRTFDMDKGWQVITYGAGLDNRTTALAVSSDAPDTIWVGTVSSGLLVSRDGGASWQKVAGVPSEAPLTFIKQDPRQPARLYVGTKQTLYLSRDGGETWQRRGGGLPFGEYYSVVINPQDSDEILVGNAYQNDAGGAVTLSGGGVYRSLDGGATWQRLDNGEARLPSQRIWALAFDPRTPGRLLVGSHSSGIYVLERKADVSSAVGASPNQ
jgi:photosystem II stability/assembly factor-like uncharacterized protein